MGLPHITSFLCCMGLEMGSRCIGALQLLLSIIFLIWFSLIAREASELKGTTADMDGLYSTVHKVMVGAIVMCILHVVLAITLLLSIKKRNIVGLRVWMLSQSALSVAALVAVVVMSALHGFNGTGSAIFLDFLEGVLFFGVVAYCILCVFSYYLRLKSAEDMEGPHKTNF